MREGVGLLLLGGDGPSREVLEPILAAAAYTLAADSGFDLARRLKIQPDLLVGDLDSVAASPELDDFPEDKVRRHPREKDETDAEIGLRTLWERGFDRVVLAGGGGGRLDHLLGLVVLFEREKYPTAWYTSRELIQAVEGTSIITGCRGQTVSFFPLGEGVSGMSSRGLQWPLDGLEWDRGNMGVSNVFSEDRCSVTVQQGRLLMVRTLAGREHAPEDKA